MAKILVCDELAEAGLQILSQAGQVVVRTGMDEAQLQAEAADADALVLRSGSHITAPVIENASCLRIIARAGVGVDNIDVAAATRCGVLVVNSPLGNTLAAAEHTIALMLAAARRIPQAAEALRQGCWSRSSFMGHQLFGKTLGLIGLGKVGFEVAKRAAAFGMKVTAWDPYIAPERARTAGVELTDSLDTLVSKADYLSLHCTLNADTRNLVSHRLLGMMKPDAVLINCARGGLVDEDALAEALSDGIIAGAALDVFADEPTTNAALLGLPNLIATPHLGASTEEAQIEVALDAARQVVEVLAGRMPRWPVNAPLLSPEAQATVQPYRPLAAALGTLARSLIESLPHRIELAAGTDLSAEHLAYLRGELVAAMLRDIVDSPVNFINASTVATERGIELAQAKTEQTGGYSRLLQVTVDTGAGRTLIAGALLNGSEPRVVHLDGYRLELLPRQTAVLIWNAESGKPGFVGMLGTLLGDAGINITGIQVAPETVAGVGLLAVTVAADIPEALREQLQGLAGVRRVEIVRLDDSMTDSNGVI